MSALRAKNISKQLRLRIHAHSEIAIGPGKVDLLRAIERTGSISGAARRMRMSYRRAWLLVQTMNECFDPPLVISVKGGVDGGGAQLTTTGIDVLAHYEAIAKVARDRLSKYLRASASQPPARRSTKSSPKPKRRRSV